MSEGYGVTVNKRLMAVCHAQSTCVSGVIIVDMLIICIDKDDDLGVKAGVKSPVIGRDACIEAASRLGAADPEDSDVNTIYGGINVYDELKAQGMNVEVVCIAGHRELGIKSDQAIATQLDDLLLKYPGTEKAVLVSDGAEDESVMPILQSRVKIESVRRVVVKQAQNLESTYYIIKELINDPKVARVIFIPLGVTFLVYAASTVWGNSNAAPVAIATLIGSYLLYKGLNLDSMLQTFTYNLRMSFQEARLTFVTYLISLILIIVGFVQGSLSVLNELTGGGSPGIIQPMAVFFNSAIWWFVVGLLAIVIGWIIDAYTEESETLYRYLATPFFLIAMGMLVWGGTQYILQMQSMGEALKNLGIGIVAAVVVSYVGVRFSRYVRNLTQYRTVEVIDF